MRSWWRRSTRAAARSTPDASAAPTAGWWRSAPSSVVPPAALIAALDQPAHLAGDALLAHADALAALPAHVIRHAAPRTPSGLGVARAALAGDRVDRLHHGAPAYIRPSEAEVKYPDGVPGAWKR
jgi:tRNA A37 threonylcarbamoyladenosine modification protein TsaB